MSGIQNSEPIWLIFICGKLFKKLSPSLLFCVSVIHICLSYVEISSFTHSDSLFIFCCVYLHNTFLNILIILYIILYFVFCVQYYMIFRI